MSIEKKEKSNYASIITIFTSGLHHCSISGSESEEEEEPKEKPKPQKLKVSIIMLIMTLFQENNIFQMIFGTVARIIIIIMTLFQENNIFGTVDRMPVLFLTCGPQK